MVSSRFHLTQQSRHIYFKRICKRLYVVNRDISFRALNGTHVCPMEAGKIRQFLLTESFFQANSTEILRKYLSS